MAEVVQFHLEKLVDIVSSIQELGIFTAHENKIIINKLRSHEYKIQKSSKTKHDYLKYISYLQMLLSLMKKRKRRCRNLLKYREVEIRMASHIKKLLRNVVYRNQQDVKLWFTFIDFCKRMAFHEDVGKIYTRMLQVHPDKKDIWIAAAKNQFEDAHSPNVARSLLQRAIRHMPDSISLWKEYFRMELMHCDMVRKRQRILKKGLDPAMFQNLSEVDLPEDENDAVLTGKIAVIVFKNAIQKLPANCVIDFLLVLDEFEPDLRTPLKKELIDITEETFPDKEDIYDVKVRCLMDKYYVRRYSESFTGEEVFKDRQKRLELANKVYREGLVKFPTIKMWNLFISFNLEILSKTGDASKRDNQLATVIELFEECWEAQLMSRHAFLEWILILQIKDDFDKIDKLMVKGCEKWSKYADVWYLRLSIMSAKVSFREELKRLFARAIKEIDYTLDSNEEDLSLEGGGLKDRSMANITIQDVWHFFIEWSSKYSHPTEVLRKIEKHFLESLEKGKNIIIQRKISSVLKPLLLEKSIELKNDGIKLARYYYDKYKTHPPLIESFFQKMLDIEMKQSSVDYDRIKNVYEDFITAFGPNDHQIWLNYCKFEIEHGKPQNVGLIHYRACKTLNPEECDAFVSSYCLLQNGSQQVST